MQVITSPNPSRTSCRAAVWHWDQWPVDPECGLTGILRWPQLDLKTHGYPQANCFMIFMFQQMFDTSGVYSKFTYIWRLISSSYGNQCSSVTSMAWQIGKTSPRSHRRSFVQWNRMALAKHEVKPVQYFLWHLLLRLLLQLCRNMFCFLSRSTHTFLKYFSVTLIILIRN